MRATTSFQMLNILYIKKTFIKTWILTNLEQLVDLKKSSTHEGAACAAVALEFLKLFYRERFFIFSIFSPETKFCLKQENNL